jgi:hypothetical protein
MAGHSKRKHRTSGGGIGQYDEQIDGICGQVAPGARLAWI